MIEIGLSKQNLFEVEVPFLKFLVKVGNVDVCMFSSFVKINNC